MHYTNIDEGVHLFISTHGEFMQITRIGVASKAEMYSGRGMRYVGRGVKGDGIDMVSL